MKHPGRLLIGVCIIAALFCVYAIATDGWQSAQSTVYWTIGIFGGISLFWAVINKVTEK